MNQIMFDLGDETTGRPSTMAVGEQPPQRLENFGVNAVSDTELLAMILQGNGVRIHQAVDLASRLIGEAGSLAGLISWTAPITAGLKASAESKAFSWESSPRSVGE